MTQISQTDGKSLVYGLTWVTVPGSKSEFGEIATLTREAGTKWYARFGGEPVKIGLVNPEFELQQRIVQGEVRSELQGEMRGEMRGEMYSAALLFSHYTLAHAPGTDSLLIHQLDEQRVAMITLIKGVPYLDFVVEVDNLDEQLHAIQNEVHTDLVVYGNRAGLTGQTLTAETLLAGAPGSAALQRIVKRWRNGKRIAGFALLLALGAGGAAWKFADLQNRLSAQSKDVDPAVAYEENVRRLLSTSGFNSAAAADSIWEIVKVREIESDGWSLKSIKCKPARCEELWQKGHGNFSSFKRGIHAPQTISLAANGLTSLVNYPLAATHSVLNKDGLPTRAEAWAELTAQQQRLRQIHPMLVLTAKNPEVRGLEPANLAGSIPAESLLYAGELTISAPLGLAADLLALRLDNFLINEVLIEALGEVRTAKIQIRGLYYAKN